MEKQITKKWPRKTLSADETTQLANGKLRVAKSTMRAFCNSIHSTNRSQCFLKKSKRNNISALR